MFTGNATFIDGWDGSGWHVHDVVQTLREMLEKLLDDDSDMHAMHLTARAMDQLERQVSAGAGVIDGPRGFVPGFADVFQWPNELLLGP